MADTEMYENVCKLQFKEVNEKIEKVLALQTKFSDKMFVGNGQKAVTVIQAENTQRINALDQRITATERRQPTTKGQRVAWGSAASVGGGFVVWFVDFLHAHITGGGAGTP